MDKAANKLRFTYIADSGSTPERSIAGLYLAPFRSVMGMKDTDYAYAAGILDGEGSIGLAKAKGRMPYPVVTVDSTDRELLEWLMDSFGGSLVIKKKAQEHHRQAWTWRLKDRAALAFLEALLPYLRINRKIFRAKLLVDEYVACTPRNGHYTPQMLVVKERLYEKFIGSRFDNGLLT